jgi:uncharacterized protein YerC
MQVSKDKLNSKVRKYVHDIFYQTISDIHSKENAKIFCRDFLTETELTVLTKRLAIAIYLEKNRSYDQIKDVLKVSSATIANVDKMMQKKSEGFVIALKRIQADEWASKLAKKIADFFEKFS